MAGLEIRVAGDDGIVLHVGRQPRIEMAGNRIYEIVIERRSVSPEVVSGIDEDDIVLSFLLPETVHKPALGHQCAPYLAAVLKRSGEPAAVAVSGGDHRQIVLAVLEGGTGANGRHCGGH